jgi:hypothetical protein
MQMFITVMFLALFIARPQYMLLGLILFYVYYKCIDQEPWNKLRKFMWNSEKKEVVNEKEEGDRGLGFSTYKETQARNIERYMKPGFEKDPEWIKRTAELKEIMRKNRLRNEAELRKEEEDRARGITN